jgi:hypothetical protein
VPGNAQFATQLEEIVLDFWQAAANIIRHHGETEYDTDSTIRLVDGTICLHARTVLIDTAAVTEAGGAIVTGLGVNLAKAMTHVSPSFLRGSAEERQTIGAVIGTVKPLTCFSIRHRP